MKRSVEWPPWPGPAGTIEYRGQAAKRREYTSACRACGRSTGRRVYKNIGPRRLRPGETAVEWVSCGDCPDFTPLVAAHLGVDVDVVRHVVESFDVPPAPYERVGTADAPIEPWSHLRHSGYAQQIATRISTTGGPCWYCGSTESSTWMATGSGISCSRKVCWPGAQSPGGLMRSRAGLVSFLLDLDVIVDRRNVQLLCEQLPDHQQPVFYAELPDHRRALYAGDRFGWFSAELVETWKHTLADIDMQRTAPEAWQAKLAERRREAELEQRVENLVDQKLRSAGG